MKQNNGHPVVQKLHKQIQEEFIELYLDKYIDKGELRVDDILHMLMKKYYYTYSGIKKIVYPLSQYEELESITS